MITMTNDEIQELIEAYIKIGANMVYSEYVRGSANRYVEKLRGQLAPEEPKEPEAVGINKWFKAK